LVLQIIIQKWHYAFNCDEISESDCLADHDPSQAVTQQLSETNAIFRSIDPKQAEKKMNKNLLGNSGASNFDDDGSGTANHQHEESPQPIPYFDQGEHEDTAEEST